MRLHTALLLIVLAAAVCIPGCKGCSCSKAGPKKPLTAEELEKKRLEQAARLREQEKKKDLRQFRYASLPHGPLGAFPEIGTANACFVKPGHWTALTFSAKANNFDIAGNLELAATAGTREAAMPGMPFSMRTQRRIALPKGQAKTFDSVFYLPEAAKPLNAGGRLDPRSGRIFPLDPLISRMPFYQYHFVVLARYPDLYGYVNKLDSVLGPNDMEIKESRQSDAYYRVSLISPGRRTPLPSRGMLWTSIAYMLWDDADPDGLSLDQQTAMLDWLHWGGQLIISGPESLDTLQSSFLADYLPATSDGSFELTAADFDEINRHWTLPIRGLPGPKLAPISKWSGAKLKKHPDAQFVPSTGELVAERRIGRGRVVVSAFKLGSREVRIWPANDGFFNGCLMRRPARRFGGGSRDVSVTWAWTQDRSNRVKQYDSEPLCNLRYFARDTGRPDTEAVVSPDGVMMEEAEDPAVDYGGYTPYDSGTTRVRGKNYAAWSDFNDVADAARESLSDASGIEVPERSFVVWIVAGYLVFLVPVNWIVFRLINRVEWAWIAAPAIAVICAVVVIRQAQLDIGFARSESEVAVVELQADYPRAHVARYCTFYTSLGTGYKFEFDDPGAQVLPFPAQGDPAATGLTVGESPRSVTYRYGSQVELDNLRLRSSRSQMTHSEHMLDVGGGFQWRQPEPGRHRVVNRTGFTVRDAGVVRMTDDGQIQTAWLGTIEPEQSVDLADRWRSAPVEDAETGFWNERRNQTIETGTGAEPGTLSLRPLLRLAEDAKAMKPGDVRLIGWTDEKLPGLEVRPSAPQRRQLAMIVAHLQYRASTKPTPDKNSRWDYQKYPNVYREDTSADPVKETDQSPDENPDPSAT